MPSVTLAFATPAQGAQLHDTLDLTFTGTGLRAFT
jgi:hypothetical protein